MPYQFDVLLDEHIAKEVSIVSEEEHSSEEESEDEETAGKVVTQAGVEVCRQHHNVTLTIANNFNVNFRLIENRREI